MAKTPKQSVKLTGLYIFVGTLISLLLLTTTFLYRNFNVFTENQKWVNHTMEVISEIDLLLSLLKDAETAQRGYIISGDLTFLEPYNEAKGEISPHLSNLMSLVKDNPVQADNVNTLEDLIQQRFGRLDSNIVSYSQRKHVEHISLVKGKEIMDKLRALVIGMKAEEDALLDARNATAEESRLYYVATLLATTILILLSILFGFYRIRQGQILIFKDNEKKGYESWLRSHGNELSKITSSHSNLNEVGKYILQYISKHFDILAANIYVQNADHLTCVAGFATDTKSSTHKKTIKIGEGLVGEAFLADEIREVTHIPENYLTIQSSLGKSTPTSLVLFPFQFQGARLGVIEFAQFKQTDSSFLNFLNGIKEILGVGVNAAVYKENLQQLLDKTQLQAEELQAQQEELRTSNEELEQQARSLETQQRSLEIQNHELEETRLEVEAKANDLERASQYKSEFLAKMSHELRTPLNSLLILTTLLMENKEKNLTVQQKDFAKSIQNSGNDLLNLINDILDLSKIEARKLTLRPESFSVQHILEQIRSTFEPQAKNKNLDLHLELNDDTGTASLFTDRQRVEQILRNFLSNALKFTENGSISITSQYGVDKNFIQFAVKDTGVGIPPAKLDLIFEAFEQADGSVSRKYGGTGLGLTISRELADLLGGRIILESEEDKGSSFTLEIPIHLSSTNIQKPIYSSAELRPMNHTVTTDRHTNQDLLVTKAKDILQKVTPEDRTILIIEDDLDFRKSVSAAVKSYGFKPVETDDGEVALEIFNHHIPQAILLDIKLPSISGLGILETIKKTPHLRHIPIHMISGLEYQQSALRMGAMGYLGKPVSIDKIRSALSRIENMLSEKVRRLLIIEDDKTQRESITHLVTGPDIEILGVASGKEALKAINETGFDCIILDLSLPDMTGADLLAKLSELDISLPPIVIYTGKDLTASEEEHLRRYSESIIIKGAKSPERLLDEVNLFLHRVEELLPEDKKEMLTMLRSQDKAFEGRTALIVDDDLRNIFALTSALEAQGIKVRIAKNGIEAIESVKQHDDIDVVLMDIMMPKMDGYEAMKQIRAMPEFTNLPIIALTAKAMKDDHEKCVKAGANDYLPKPINLKNLFSVLKVWLQPKGIFQ